jgi:hypothetical protein
MSDDLPVVCNAGPLMVLAKLNQLHLLKELYGRVRLANSVYDETVIEGMRRGHEDARTLLRFLMQMGWEADTGHGRNSHRPGQSSPRSW